MENDFGARNFYYEVNFRRNKRLSMHSFLVSFLDEKKIHLIIAPEWDKL